MHLRRGSRATDEKNTRKEVEIQSQQQGYTLLKLEKFKFKKNI